MSRDLLSPQLRENLYAYMYILALAKSTKNRAAYMRRIEYDGAAVVLSTFGARIHEVRLAYGKLLSDEIKDHPMNRAAKGVYNLNGLNLFKLLYYVDLEKADTPAALWRHCGLGVSGDNSDYVARAMGTKVSWSVKANNQLTSVRAMLLFQKSPYRSVYDARRQVEEIQKYNRPKRAHQMALRYTQKVWLKHVWIVGRTVLDLEVGEPHPDDATADPAQFGWRMGEIGNVL